MNGYLITLGIALFLTIIAFMLVSWLGGTAECIPDCSKFSTCPIPPCAGNGSNGGNGGNGGDPGPPGPPNGGNGGNGGNGSDPGPPGPPNGGNGGNGKPPHPTPAPQPKPSDCDHCKPVPVGCSYKESQITGTTLSPTQNHFTLVPSAGLCGNTPTQVSAAYNSTAHLPRLSNNIMQLFKISNK